MSFKVFNPLTGLHIHCDDEVAVVAAVADIQKQILDRHPIGIVDEILGANGDVTWVKSQLSIPNVALVVSQTTGEIPVTKL